MLFWLHFPKMSRLLHIMMHTEWHPLASAYLDEHRHQLDKDTLALLLLDLIDMRLFSHVFGLARMLQEKHLFVCTKHHEELFMASAGLFDTALLHMCLHHFTPTPAQLSAALEQAVAHDSFNASRDLVDLGAMPTEKSLDLAASRPNCSIIRLLLRSNPFLTGTSAIHIALQRGYSEAVGVLKSFRVVLDRRAYEYAIVGGDAYCMNIINPKCGRKLLHIAVRANSVSGFNFLAAQNSILVRRYLPELILACRSPEMYQALIRYFKEAP